MRPTFSIIVFTVLSGAGYGVWFLLGVGLLFVWPHCGHKAGPDTANIVSLCTYPSIIRYALFTGFVLVSVGLSASVAHLGRPIRAWRALSQWRSSWLSREGVAALLVYLPAMVIAAYDFLSTEIGPESSAARMQLWRVLDSLHKPLGALLAFGALLTVFCTANIYRSLKPVRAWHNALVTPAYLLLGVYSGALMLGALATWPHAWANDELPFLLGATGVLAAACAIIKYLYWRDIDRAPQIDAGRATGLDTLGVVRSFEAPHTEENYLTHEMGFVLARKHSTKLRSIALIVGFIAPALLALLGLFVPAGQTAAIWLALCFG
ncbi:MAG TPA: DmsC/YnfH family molybdoenzyme membrane anchor subunit, partial [Rhodanobacteraceae bacterium]|nr:DmsC/YnfH family molybdoenzyme membrane anchor subunit [Rhodanobacteraceae bacterium]